MLRIIALGLVILLLSSPGTVPSPEAAAVARLVEEFGRSLKHVSLLAPAEAVEESMRRHYGEYVVPELLEEWLLYPSKAPGRAVSSPWPDRIEVIKITKGFDNTYEVDGEIVEVTSSGEAARISVTLVVEKWGGSWLIRTLLLLPPG